LRANHIPGRKYGAILASGRDKGKVLIAENLAVRFVCTQPAVASLTGWASVNN
jgi:hypothetical protein